MESSRVIFESKLLALEGAINHCLGKQFWEPTLILLYSAIDAIAWLDRPEGRPDGTRDDFIDWVTKYMLPDSDMKYTAVDLYGARCGLLHSQTGESSLHRGQNAIKLWYKREINRQTKGIVQLGVSERTAPLILDIDLLVADFRRACELFKRAICADSSKLEVVLDRVNHYYFSTVTFMS